MRWIIPIVIALVVFGIAFSTSDFDISFTKEVTSSTYSFKSDIIKVLGYSSTITGNCEFNVTEGTNLLVSDTSCNSAAQINFESYGHHTITVTIHNSTKSSSETFFVNVVPCKDLKINNKLNSEWLYLDLNDIHCEGNPQIKITSDKSGYIYDGKWIQGTTHTYQSKPKYISLVFPSQSSVELTLSDGYHSVSSTISLSDPSFDMQLSDTCPGKEETLNVTSSPTPLLYDTEGNKLTPFGVYYGDILLGNLSSDTTEIDNVKLPYASSVEYKIKFFDNEFYSKQIDLTRFIGPYAYKNITQNVSLNCFDSRELPVPCNASYVIRVFLRDTGGDNTDFNYAVKLIVEHSSEKYPYNDSYIVKHISGQSYVDFNFDGKTNKMCTYYASTDVVCLHSPNVCYSKSMDSIYTGKLCTSNITFTAPCPAPTLQKRYHDVKTEALPLHINFGIFKDSLSISNNLPLGDNSQLYRLINSKIKEKQGNIKLSVVRYNYVWKIEPFNFLVSVILNNTDIPIRVGFNQSFTSSLFGVRSPCAGNSTCYTKMPYCGDGICDTAAGENCLTCKADCGCGPNTLGCYGVPNVQGFTDSHGCIYRYKQYEENCTFNDECDSSKGLYCDFHEINGEMSQIGHCCKQGEIWDPTTPVGFKDANSSIKGTCRVPRGVKIVGVSVSEGSSHLKAPCGGNYIESVPDEHVAVKVKNYNPKGENVCVLFVTSKSYCCCGGEDSPGAAEIKCKRVYAGDTTFNFYFDMRAPHIGCNFFGLDCHIERSCHSNAAMLIFAFIPVSNYSLNTSLMNTANLNEYFGGDPTKIYDNISDILNSPKYDFSSNVVSVNSSIDYIVADQPRKSECTSDISGATFNGYTCKGGDYLYGHGNQPVVDLVNGHSGNILANANEEYDWYDLWIIHPKAGGCSDSVKSLVKHTSYYDEYTPTGHTTHKLSTLFVCGGIDFW